MDESPATAAPAVAEAPDSLQQLVDRVRSMGVPRVLDAVAVFVIPALVYATSSPWAPDGWDYGEAQVVPYVLGIMHPTGFPAFVLLGWLFTHVVPFGPVAYRMNLLCGLAMAGSAALTRQIGLTLGAGRLSAFAGALIFAFGDIAWTKGTHADVHAVALAFALLSILASARYIASAAPRWLWCGAIALGLALATHPIALGAAPALLVALVVAGKQSLRRASIGAALAAAPLLLYLYLPIRSIVVAAYALDPVGRWPFNGAGTIVWDFNRPRYFSGLMEELFAGNYGSGAPGVLGAFLRFWEYPHYAVAWAAQAAPELTVFTIVIAVAGAVAVLSAPSPQRLAGIGVLAAMFSGICFAVAYAPREGGDWPRYLLPSFALACAIAAAATRALARWRAADPIAGVAMLGIAAQLYFQNDGRYIQRYGTGAESNIDEIRSTVPDGAVVISSWLDATGLAYGAYVDRSLGSRVVMSWSGELLPSYLDWTKEYRIFVYANFELQPDVDQLRKTVNLVLVKTADPSHKLYELMPGPLASPHA
jgi:hypothetical protein